MKKHALAVLAVFSVLAPGFAAADEQSDAAKMAQEHKHDKPTATAAATRRRRRRSPARRWSTARSAASRARLPRPPQAGEGRCPA